ncbi:MAG: hypothetical protein LBJ12_02250, partial [Oscillospiraceae bacterium]|nr:hypothetical protein [Oscillospiraceae bacterium]
MKKYLSLSIILLVALVLSSCGKQPIIEAKAPPIAENILVEVNGEIILKSEIDSVYEQVKGTRITYQKIVEDTISEILVI